MERSGLGLATHGTAIPDFYESCHWRNTSRSPPQRAIFLFARWGELLLCVGKTHRQVNRVDVFGQRAD